MVSMSREERGDEFGQAIAGNDASNTIDGRGGNDTVVGLGGNDTFAFTTAFDATGNVDTIRDFTAESDKIELASDVWAGVTGAGIVAGGLVLVTAAPDFDDRVVYDQATGRLLYKADGSGAGAVVLFMQVSRGTELREGDFLVIEPVSTLPPA